MMSEISIPPRKRRRPALSCVECRRRKIKCDRRMPCSHCMQLKSILCTYPETHSNVINRRNVPKPSPNPLSVNRPLGSPGGNGPTTLTSEGQSSDRNPLPNLPSLAILPNLSGGSHSEIGSWDPTPVNSVGDSPSETNARNLVSRSRNPEEVSSPSRSFNGHTDDVMSVLGTEFSSFGDVMLQVGSHHPTRTFAPSHITGMEDQKCDPNKTQFFGRSHWMNTFNMFSRRFRYEDINGKFVTGIETDEVREIFEKCRRIDKALKAKLPTGMDASLNFENQVPPQDLADQLIDLYFRTYESVYRILHIPSFRKEYADYWKDPENTSTNFIVKLVLVMAVGTCFYQGEGAEELRNSAREWVFSAQTWTSGLFEKKLLNISILQIHCLLLLARQITAVGVDLIWIPSGNLIRIAFSMGFHRDPKHFPKLPIFVAEMRRRIWATVLEMTVQNSIDLGMPPLITSNDFDTESPSNINDEDISENTTVMPTPKPNHVFTQSSIQISLLKSLHTRLAIAQFVNSFHSEPTYDEVLRFGQEISRACNDAHRLIQSYPTHLPRPTAFQTNLLDLYVRRFVLEVHRPFNLRSQTDPRYYFSRKVCLENALAIFFPSGTQELPKSHDLQHMDDYECLMMVGGGLFKTVFFLAITIITVELMLQLDEDIASGLPPSVQTKASREPLYQATKYIAKLATDRVRKGEDNIKGPVFFNAAAALIHAKASGMPPGYSVPDAAKRSANECLEIFKSRLSRITNTPEAESQLNGALGLESESNGNPDFGFDLMMPDSGMNFGTEDDNFGFQMQDSWLFTNWDAS